MLVVLWLSRLIALSYYEDVRRRTRGGLGFQIVGRYGMSVHAPSLEMKRPCRVYIQLQSVTVPYVANIYLTWPHASTKNTHCIKTG